MLKNWNDVVISGIAQISDALGPVAKIIDSVMDRVTSVQTVQACGGNVIFCSSRCVFAYCNPYGGNTLRIDTYGPVGPYGDTSQSCGPYTTKCQVDICGGC